MNPDYGKALMEFTHKCSIGDSTSLMAIKATKYQNFYT
jgi:hypothetical protein